MKKYSKKTKEELQIEVKEMSEAIEKQLKEYLASDDYQSILNIVAKFRQYSLNNRILIHNQMPTASYVASLNAWNKNFEHQVKKGSKAIKIFAPIIVKRKIKEEDDNGDEITKEIEYMRYKLVPVFDISQTDGPDLPGINLRLDGECEKFDEYLQKIKDNTNDFEIIVKTNNNNQQCKGYCDFSKHQIVVYENSKLQMLKTLIHEKAHSILHGDLNNGLSKNDRECQAESVAYIVCKYLGYDTSSYSNAYLCSWTKSYEFPEIKKGLNDIIKASQSILNLLVAE